MTFDHVSIPAHVHSQTLGRETLLLDLRGDRYYGLQGAGSALWSALRETEEIEEALAALRSVYDVDETRLRQDVGAIVDELVERGLLVPCVKERSGGRQ